MATRREDLGSWLEGTTGGSSDGRESETGLPAQGPGSLATVARRGVALVVDWGLCLAISSAFFPDPSRAGLAIVSGDPLATLVVFAVSTTVLVGLLGHTVGHRLVGLRVVRLPADGQEAPAKPGRGLRGPGFVAALLRTVLLCLVIPAAIWNAQGRGMHDVAAGTAVVRG